VAITTLIRHKHKEFGIKDPITASMIKLNITYALESALLMAENGGMRDYLKTTTQEIRQYREGEGEKKKSRLPFGLFGGKGDD